MIRKINQHIQRFIDRHVETWTKQTNAKRLVVDAKAESIFRSLQQEVRVMVNGRTHTVQKVEISAASEGHSGEILVFLDEGYLLNIHDGHLWYVEVIKGTRVGCRFTRWKPQLLDEVVTQDVHLARQ